MGTMPAPPVAPTPPIAPARRRRGFGCIGCLGALILGCLVVLALELLLNPWAFHMGGRPTPLTVWQGVGVLRGTNGSRDVLYLRIWLAARGMTHARYSTRGRSTFTGQALVGTPQGAVQSFQVMGDLRTAWWDADRVPLYLGLRIRRGMRGVGSFTLYGQFEGQRLVLDDHGTSGLMFRPDGNLYFKGAQFRSTAYHEHTEVTLDYNDRSAFEALHRRLIELQRGARPG